MVQRAGGGARGRGRRASDAEANGPGEFASAPVVRTGLISGGFGIKGVEYVVVDGLALFEGDIVLGTEEEVAAQTELLRQEVTEAAGVIITGAQFRWPNCRVPYTIDPALPNQSRVTDAIAHWEANTRFRFVPRTSETDYVTFRPGSGCSSSVGRRGGQQFVNLAGGCTTGSTIHEIGHVVGLWHEQSREDRDAFVTIIWAKIQAGREHNFYQHITDGDDVGAYDYDSIMHYPRDAFSVDGSDTITPVAPGVTIGQRTSLSAGDIAAANSMCPIVKPIIKDLRKDQIKDVQKDVRFDTRKEIIKDLVFDTRKELVRDTLKEQIKDRIKEVAKDQIKEAALDPPFGKLAASDPIGPGPVVVRPGPLVGPRAGAGGGMPFAVATPHAAPAAGAEAELEAAAYELDAQLGTLAEQIAQADAVRGQLQAQYDELAAQLDQSVQAHDQPS